MAEFEIQLEFFWQSEQTDCSDCNICGDPIYSKMYRASMKQILETNLNDVV